MAVISCLRWPSIRDRNGIASGNYHFRWQASKCSVANQQFQRIISSLIGHEGRRYAGRIAQLRKATCGKRGKFPEKRDRIAVGITGCRTIQEYFRPNGNGLPIACIGAWTGIYTRHHYLIRFTVDKPIVDDQTNHIRSSNIHGDGRRRRCRSRQYRRTANRATHNRPAVCQQMPFRISRCRAVKPHHFTQTSRYIWPRPCGWRDVDGAALWSCAAFGTCTDIFDCNTAITIGITRIVPTGDGKIARGFDNIDVDLIDDTIAIGIAFHRYLRRDGSDKQYQCSDRRRGEC